MKQRSSDTKAANARAEDLGAAIRRHRGELTQTELAARLFVSQSAVSQWETGITQITAEHVIRLERELGLRSGSLLIEAGYIDESLLGLDSARRFALWKLQSAVALLSAIGGGGMTDGQLNLQPDPDGC